MSGLLRWQQALPAIGAAASQRAGPCYEDQPVNAVIPRPPGLMDADVPRPSQHHHAVQDLDSYGDCHSVACRSSVCERSALPISRFQQPISGFHQGMSVVHDAFCRPMRPYRAITCRCQSRCEVPGRRARRRTRTGWHNDCGVGMAGQRFCRRGGPGCMRHRQRTKRWDHQSVEQVRNLRHP